MKYGTIAPLRNVATYQSRHTLVLFSLHAAGRAENSSLSPKVWQYNLAMPVAPNSMPRIVSESFFN